MTSESTKEEQTMVSEPMEVDKSNEEELAEAMNQRANELYSCKNYKEALESYNKVVELCPSKAQYYCNRAACYLMLDQYRNALADAKKSLQLDPTLPKAYLRIIRSALLLGDVFEAETTLQKALEALPNPDQYPIKKEEKSLDFLKYFLKDGENAYAAKDFRKVVYCMDRCLHVSPSCATFKLMKAECLAFLGRYKEAERIAIDIIHVDKQNIEAIYIRGMCLYYQDNVDRAIAHFQQVLRLVPDHVKAIEIYKKATSLKKKKEEGNAAFKLGKYQTAYNLYNKALLIDPKNYMTNAKLHFNKATVAAKLGKFEESVTECTEALKVDEQYVKALFRRASSYMELKQYEEAVRDLENACKMDESREYKRLLYEAKQALKKSKRKDYYKILGIDKNASTDDIKKAYRKRAKVHHPDRHPNSSEAEKREQEKKFKEVGEAYGILSDPKKRSRYDRGYDVEDGDNSQADVDPMFQAFFGNPGGVFQFQGFDSSGCTFQFH